MPTCLVEISRDSSLPVSHVERRAVNVSQTRIVVPLQVYFNRLHGVGYVKLYRPPVDIVFSVRINQVIREQL